MDNIDGYEKQKSGMEESLEMRSIMVDYLNRTGYVDSNLEDMDDLELVKLYNLCRKDKLEIDC